MIDSYQPSLLREVEAAFCTNIINLTVNDLLQEMPKDSFAFMIGQRVDTSGTI